MSLYHNILCKSRRNLSGVYTSNLFNDLEFYLGQILSFYEAKSLGQCLAQIKIQIGQQIGCVDAAFSAAAYQLGNTSSRTITEVKQR